MPEIFGNTLSTSKQKPTQSATEASSRSQCVENIRSRHSFSDWDPQQAGNPYQWHAIHRAKIAHQQRLTKLLVGPTHHQEIDVRRRKQKRSSRVDRRINTPQDGRKIERIERHSEYTKDFPRKVVRICSIERSDRL